MDVADVRRPFGHRRSSPATACLPKSKRLLRSVCHVGGVWSRRRRQAAVLGSADSPERGRAVLCQSSVGQRDADADARALAARHRRAGWLQEAGEASVAAAWVATPAARLGVGAA
eukprot:366029-Chlamydomonas_euryale.AAC.29